jgi:hypothetical protein
MKYQKPLKCPYCKKELIKGEQKRYETLGEHVFNPNMREHPLRDTFVCTCEKSQGMYWDDWGDYYSKKYRSDCKEAINSGSWKCEKRFAREHMMRKTIIGKWILDLIAHVSYCIYRLKFREI